MPTDRVAPLDPWLESSLIVFERFPYWGPELQRRLWDHRIGVLECRSVNDIDVVRNDIPKAAIILVLDAAPAECLGWLTDGFHRRSSDPRIVISSSEFAEFEWLVRDCGATFLDDELDRSLIAHICLTALKNCPTQA